MSYITKTTIGDKLRQKRIEKGLSLEEVSFDTRIPKSKLESIEKSEFSRLPSHVYAKGFIRNYAKYLKLNPETLLAIYRRDFEGEGFKRKVKKSADEEGEAKQKSQIILKLKRLEFNLTYKHLVLGAVIVVMSVISFLVASLLADAFSSPRLKITLPVSAIAPFRSEFKSRGNTVVVRGEASEDSVVRINEKVIEFKPGFIFESEPIPILEPENIITITATSKLGVVSKVVLVIERSNNGASTSTQTDGVAIIKVVNAPTFLIARCDGEVKYNSEAFENETFSLVAREAFEIETMSPQNVHVFVNNQELTLELQLERFEKRGKEFERITN